LGALLFVAVVSDVIVAPVLGGDECSGARAIGVACEWCEELNDDFRTNELPGFKRLLFTTAVA
jgi:hypothetical protein